MRFLKKCTPVEHHMQVQRVTEEENERYEAREHALDVEKVRQAERTQEEAKVCQWKHRQKKYDEQIKQGERTLGGTKRAMKVNIG